MTTKAAIETPVKRKEAPEAQGIGKLAHYPCGLASGHLVLENKLVDDQGQETGAGDGGGTYLPG